MNQDNNQVTFFNDNSGLRNIDNIKNDNAYSKKIYDSFEECNFRFSLWGTELTDSYHNIVKTIPKETVSFSMFSLETAVICEFISSAICHQINWDYIRRKIRERVSTDSNWITVEHMASIDETEIQELLFDYSKPERIDSLGRSKILRELADTYKDIGFERIFFSENGTPNEYEFIRRKLLRSKTFSQDLVEKKLQLLLMKLSNYNGFGGLANKCKPTIDYHLIRSYIRRGFLMMKNSSGMNFVVGDVIHGENTLAAVRKHCVNIVYSLTSVTGLSVSEINLAEWWIGRSICVEGTPDCFMKGKESQWLKVKFSKCPFYKYCLAINNNNSTQLFLDEFEKKENLDLKEIESPNYSGKNY